MRGRYVVLEGGEGVGKTTQAELLAARLRATGVAVEVVREPGGDPFAEAGRELLLGDLPRTGEAEVLLFNALRAQVLLTRVLPALERDTWVVSDRSRLSTLAYQGYGRGVNIDWTRAVCADTVALCPADLELVLQADETIVQARRERRGVTDQFERLDDAFHQRVVAGYLTEAAAAGIDVVDASGSPAEVAEAIWARVQPLGVGGSSPG